MEFYNPTGGMLWLDTTKFQFPTGWNSTQEKARSRYFKFMVSIPNGMEFYASGSDYVRFDNVSIPNGMEFYTSILSFGLPSMAGFNSQRDGILQLWPKTAR